MKAACQNYHLYIHKVLAQLSLHVEAQPSQAQLILNTNFPNRRCWQFCLSSAQLSGGAARRMKQRLQP